VKIATCHPATYPDGETQWGVQHVADRIKRLVCSGE
jgi:hypothetical protein